MPSPSNFTNTGITFLFNFFQFTGNIASWFYLCLFNYKWTTFHININFCIFFYLLLISLAHFSNAIFLELFEVLSTLFMLTFHLSLVANIFSKFWVCICVCVLDDFVKSFLRHNSHTTKCIDFNGVVWWLLIKVNTHVTITQTKE